MSTKKLKRRIADIGKSIIVKTGLTLIGQQLANNTDALVDDENVDKDNNEEIGDGSNF